MYLEVKVFQFKTLEDFTHHVVFAEEEQLFCLSHNGKTQINIILLTAPFIRDLIKDS